MPSVPELSVKKCVFHLHPHEDIATEKLSNALEVRLRHHGCSKQHSLKPQFNIATLGKILRIRQNSPSTGVKSCQFNGKKYMIWDNSVSHAHALARVQSEGSVKTNAQKLAKNPKKNIQEAVSNSTQLCYANAQDFEEYPNDDTKSIFSLSTFAYNASLGGAPGDSCTSKYSLNYQRDKMESKLRYNLENAEKMAQIEAMIRKKIIKKYYNGNFDYRREY